MIEIYTKKNCGACLEAKRLLDEAGYLYLQYTLDEQITKEQLMAKFPDAKTVPIIVINGNKIGGLSDLKMMLENNENIDKTLLTE
jgi:glutaredoxin 3